MSRQIQIEDTATGRTITYEISDFVPKVETTSKKQGISYTDQYNKRVAETEKEISKRGNLYQDIATRLQSPSSGQKVIGSLQAIGAPLQQLESGIANPLLSIQAGNYNPINLAKESYAGLQGVRQGELGDLFYRGGLNKPMASALGLAVTVGAPAKAAQATGKFFNGISKMTDKGILKSGEVLVKATQEAKKFTGLKLEEVFKPFNNVSVDSNALLNVLKKLPKTATVGIEENIGYIKDIVKNPSIASLRQIKHFLGELRPSAFGKEARGVAETLEGKYINEVYGGIKRLMENTLKSNFGDKAAQSLMSAEKAYSSVSKSANYVKKTIVDSTLGLPTKAGEAARKLVAEGDVTFRSALNTLRNSGKVAKKDIDKAVSSLEKFNRWMSLKKGATMAAKAATYGGAIGALGGAVAGKIIGREND